MQHQHRATILPFRPVNGLTANDRRLLRLVDQAEQRITTVERRGKTAEQVRGVPPIAPAMLAKVNGGDAWDEAADRALNPFIGWTIALGLGTLAWALVFFVVTL